MTPAAPPAPHEPPAPSTLRPASLTDLFLSFTWLALQGFGGVLAVVQRELVENKRWMTRDEFVEEWAVAQVMPGPNVINLGIMLGGRWFGFKGALTAMAGLMAAPFLIVMALGILYGSFQSNPQVQGALRGMGSITAGLITGTAFKMMPALGKHPLGVAACLMVGATTFLAVVVLRLPLAWVLFGLGGLCCLVTWTRLKP